MFIMMDLQEVVNPHYAFPIVGVILCALLVFAFGFKSPGQPPSFDVVEEERKSKKRKGKDNQKVKSQQNGKPAGTPPSQKTEVHVSSGRGKSSGDKQQQKIESKQNKKNKASQQQQASPQVRQPKRIEVHVEKNEIPLDDNNEGEWVQQLSKKERKNRKKEEMISVVNELEKNALNESPSAHRENVVVVVDPSSDSQGSTPSKKTKNTKQKEEKNKQDKINVLPVTVPLTEPETNNVSAEQGQQKKKKGKKEEMPLEKNVAKNDISAEPKNKVIANSDSISNTAPSVEEEVKEESVILKAQEVDETSEQATVEEDTKGRSKKKKGKKKQDSNLIEEVAEVETNLIKESSSKTTIEEAENSETEPIKSAMQDNIQNNENIDHETEVESKQNIDSGSNVVFDEMQEMWQNPKTQRKKKKARRDQ